MAITPAHLETIAEENGVVLKDFVGGHKRIMRAARRAWGHVVRHFGGATWLCIAGVSLRSREERESEETGKETLCGRDFFSVLHATDRSLGGGTGPF
jgi:hypothetical protein